MGLTVDNIVPWGRSLNEYRQMFALSQADLQQSIIDCAAGPASFNAEMTALGHSVLSCDPIYQFSPDDIHQRIQETKAIILEGVNASLESYVWKTFASPEQLCEARLATMQIFLEDLPQGRMDGRYQTAALPNIPAQSNQFKLALCSHFLFSYSDHLSLEFHWKSIQEMLRVAQEVRIFPLLTLAGNRSPFIGPIMQQATTNNIDAHLTVVNYEFQKNGNQMLILKNKSG